MIDYPEIKQHKKLINSFIETRQRTEDLCGPLEIEDFSVQPTEFVSPPKWHLAHSTWFFEQFLLVKYESDYTIYNEDYAYLFNSYYNNMGERVLRPNRGNMTRPTVENVLAYRQYVTEKIIEMLQRDCSDEMNNVLAIGINHEQQHQELLVYDIKFILGHQPTFPEYGLDLKLKELKEHDNFVTVEEGIYKIGHMSDGYSFDNEHGAHKVYLHGFSISQNLVTNREYLEFMEDGAYGNFNLWHADGWDWVNKNNIKAPLYWHQKSGEWICYTGSKLSKINLGQPVMHISYYEAYAYASWKGMRLPTEFEWEVASKHLEWGQLWEWTNSAYLPYPNFKMAPGALGEYNGKFMVNQMVLRGASIATPENHKRYTYRNFFQPEMRWLFSGIRLAK